MDQKTEKEKMSFASLDQAYAEKGLGILVGKHPEFDLFPLLCTDRDVVLMAQCLLDLTEDYSFVSLEGAARESQLELLSSILFFLRDHAVRQEQSLFNVFIIIQAAKQELELMSLEGLIETALPPEKPIIQALLEQWRKDGEPCWELYQHFQKQAGKAYGEILSNCFDRFMIFCPEVQMPTS